jgi:cytochrome b subunit of formate dehydrogenase
MKPIRVLWVCCVALWAIGCGRVTPAERQAQPAEVQVPSASPVPIVKDPADVRRALANSVHAKLDCSDCHAPTKGSAAGKARCAGLCHQPETVAYLASVHGTARKHGNENAAACYDCHGAHDVRKVTDPESRVSPRNTPFTCGRCHANPKLAAQLGIEAPKAGMRYLDSIHGKALVEQGLLVAPSCADCHGRAHNIFKASDPRSTVNRFQIADTCGHCHAGPKARYLSGIHGQALAREAAAKGVAFNGATPAPGLTPSALGAGVSEVSRGKQPPTCVTCHSAHSIAMPGPRFQLASDKICGSCHEDRLRRYMDTYHGQAHDLGALQVASCQDCHGQHRILPTSDPASRLSAANRIKTCRKCHADAPPKFAGYYAHADPKDGVHYPKVHSTFIAMGVLLFGVFGFFGLHTILWLTRSLIERFRNKKAFREEKRLMRQENGARLYRRFRPIDRFIHVLVFSSFLTLVATGMPLRYHTAGWAHWFFRLIGGAAVAASVHRFAAVITLTYFALHLGSLFVLARKKRGQYVDERGKFSTRRFLKLAFGPDSPFPRWQDFKDVWNHVRWFVGLGPKPKFDRFTYWEKFDYMAVFWGVAMIGASGLILWFPTVVTHVLPGWVINVAHVIHGDEALLAAGFIFVFHFFNSHFRPDKFPYDPVMFSGRVTEEELRHERPAQYERMRDQGELDETVAEGEWAQWKPIINPFGVAALVIGIVLAVAIFYAIFF